MTVDDFVAMTQRVITRDGFDGYLPTLVLPAHRHISVLEGMPADVNVETAARDWALRDSKSNEDYFLAFKVDDHHFKVVARLGGVTSERAVVVEAE